MSGFSDKLSVNDGVAIALNCGLCNQPAGPDHRCTIRYLRNPAVVHVRDLGNDQFHVHTDYGEEYMITRAVLKGSGYYEEL